MAGSDLKDLTARLRKETRVAATLCRTQGVVEAKDLVTGDKAVVLRNEGLRYQVEVEDFTTGNTLSTFSLIFTEFESEGFLFHTTWQWEVGMWRERASSVWDMLTLKMLDWEVPSWNPGKVQATLGGTPRSW
jgi:hemin uptake protein HemP